MEHRILSDEHDMKADPASMHNGIPCMRIHSLMLRVASFKLLLLLLPKQATLSDAPYRLRTSGFV